MARPPGTLIARLVQGIVMPVAQRHGELIRHLEPECARLGEANVMRVCRPPPADEAWLVGDEGEVRLIADARVFGDEQLTRHRGLDAGCGCSDAAGSGDEARSRVSPASEVERPPVSLASVKTCSRAFNAAPMTRAGSSPLTNPARETAARLSRLASQKAYKAARVRKSCTHCKAAVTTSATLS